MGTLHLFYLTCLFLTSRRSPTCSFVSISQNEQRRKTKQGKKKKRYEKEKRIRFEIETAVSNTFQAKTRFKQQNYDASRHHTEKKKGENKQDKRKSAPCKPKANNNICIEKKKCPQLNNNENKTQPALCAAKAKLHYRGDR